MSKDILIFHRLWWYSEGCVKFDAGGNTCRQQCLKVCYRQRCRYLFDNLSRTPCLLYKHLKKLSVALHLIFNLVSLALQSLWHIQPNRNAADRFEPGYSAEPRLIIDSGVASRYWLAAFLCPALSFHVLPHR